MKGLVVEAWSPDYGAALDAEPFDASSDAVDVHVEVAPEHWSPLRPSAAPARCVRFIDGIRRVDARVWITGDDGVVRPGIAGSVAAGLTCCDGSARIERVEIRRQLLSAAMGLEVLATRAGTYAPRDASGDSAEELIKALQQSMRALEGALLASAPEGDLLIVDGPLRDQQAPAQAVGYVKSHQTRYLPAELERVVEQLHPGERTPLFGTPGRDRLSWYLRLPCVGAAHAWSGIVRCEVRARRRVDAARVADLTTATLPRFASTPYKDPRAPQNLYPIAGLERVLRQRLGDPSLLERALRVAALPA